jgi:hypothetical protein
MGSGNSEKEAFEAVSTPSKANVWSAKFTDTIPGVPGNQVVQASVSCRWWRAQRLHLGYVPCPEYPPDHLSYHHTDNRLPRWRRSSPRLSSSGRKSLDTHSLYSSHIDRRHPR